MGAFKDNIPLLKVAYHLHSCINISKKDLFHAAI